MRIGSGTFLLGDCLDVMRGMADASVDAIVTDPPYELTTQRPGGRSPATQGAVMKGFMGMAWDGTGIANNVDVWRECLRVLKSGGHLLSFGGARTYHRMACAVEDAGFEIRDQIMWLYGSGFPKSLDVSKAIEATVLTGDSAPKNIRMRDMGDDYRAHELAGTVDYGKGRMSRGADTDRDYTSAPMLTVPDAIQWAGYGTALKPAHEPIVLARKPLIGTVAANVLAHGTGALNIDACRVPGEPTIRNRTDSDFGIINDDGWTPKPGINGSADGRWPANIIHDGNVEFPASPGQIARASSSDTQRAGQNTYGVMRRGSGGASPRGDSGSAARFFYCAKASRKDRGEGNTHPTVKPTALMEYLIRLVAPEGATVLDPFGGSGTTAIAAERTGRNWVCIERDEAYYRMATMRAMLEALDPQGVAA